MSEVLERKIAAVRLKHSLVEGISGAAMALAAFNSVVLVAAFLDWWLNFPFALRVVLLCGYVAGTGYILFRYTILPTIRTPDDESIALWVEREEPSLESRLIATVQFESQPVEDAGISRGIIAAMISQTEELVRSMNFMKVVKTNRLLKLLAAAVVSILITATVAYAGGATPRDLIARVFLSTRDVPTKTRIECLTGACTMARGDNLAIDAKATGWLVAAGRVEVQYNSGRVQIVPLDQSKDEPSAYAAMMESVQESFSYRLRLFDGSTEWYKVTVTPRPAVLNLTCSVAYPPYTRLGTKNKQPSDLTMLAGSTLRVKIAVNKPLRLKSGENAARNAATLYGTDHSASDWNVPLVVNPQNREECSVELIPKVGTAGFSLQLVDDDNITSKDPTIYRLEVTPDRAPTIQIVKPERKEVLLTKQSELGIGYIADDDYGIAKVTMRYRLNSGDEQTMLVPTEANARVLKTDYVWALAKVKLPGDKMVQEGDVVEYWLEAEDQNTITGPGRTATEHYQARIVSKADKQKELVERMGEQLTGMKVITERQDDASRSLIEAIGESPASRPTK